MSEVEFYENREAWGWAERMYARTSEITYDIGDIYNYEGYPAR